MQIKILKDLPEIKGKRILVRVDFNVPLKDDGSVQDDTRIEAALPTINYLLEKNAKVILMSHLGRPGGEIKEELRLTKVAEYLSKLINKPVKKLDEIMGEEVEKEIEEMNDGEIIMLENTRFDKGEKSCEENFTKSIAKLGEFFVNDAFGTAHRKHASTAGLAEHLDSYAGLLMEKEINALSPLINEKPPRPLTMIFGGAKIDTKIGIIKNFLKKADYFLIGGALANTFLAAAGYNVAKSLYEEEKTEIAREIMLEAKKEGKSFLIPHDAVVASEISKTVESLDVPVQDVIGDMKILDIGKLTTEKYKDIIKKSKTVIWNGPVGLYEFPQFQNGSRQIAETLANHECTSVLGGGDTIDCINRFNIPENKFTHVSTGGGASLEFLSGEKLPGIECLKK